MERWQWAEDKFPLKCVIVSEMRMKCKNSSQTSVCFLVIQSLTMSSENVGIFFSSFSFSLWSMYCKWKEYQTCLEKLSLSLNLKYNLLLLYQTQPSSCFTVSYLILLFLPISSPLAYQVIFVFDEQAWWPGHDRATFSSWSFQMPVLWLIEQTDQL